MAVTRARNEGARPLDVLQWLLRFREVDISALQPRALLALRDEVMRFAHTQESRGVQYPLMSPNAMVWIGPGLVRGVPADRVRAALLALQSELRQGFETLLKGQRWLLPAAPTLLRLEGLKDEEGFRCYRVIKGGPEDSFRAAVAATLVACWHQIRTCQAPGCARLFAPDDPRQKYCTPECGKRARWDRFAPTRTRDYHAEYAARQAKRTSAKVRVGRRRRA